MFLRIVDADSYKCQRCGVRRIFYILEGRKDWKCDECGWVIKER